MLRLVNATMEWEKEIMDFRQEFVDNGERISGGVGLEKAESCALWLAGEYAPHYGKVKEAVFLAVNEENKVVGISDIRLEENDFIRQFAGQLGYSVRKSERRKGYATEILRLTLQEAKKLGFEKILVTCNCNNLASAGTIEKNGGIIHEVIPHPGFPDVNRYWFEL